MPSSLTTIADALTQCKKEFAVQLLENTNTTLTQLSSFDTCSTDVKVVSQCISAKPEAAAAADAAAPQAVASDGTSMAQEVMGEACAASVSGSSNATGCPSQRAAQVMAGASLMSGGGLIMAPVSDTSVLAISPSNTRGSITWRALCWCEETYDPVCDAMTRKQYPNACSAQCQVGVVPWDGFGALGWVWCIGMGVVHWNGFEALGWLGVGSGLQGKLPIARASGQAYEGRPGGWRGLSGLLLVVDAQ